METSLGQLRGISKVKLESFVRSTLGPPLPLHISLSCPLLLRSEQKEGFQSLVAQVVRDHARKHGTFKVSFSDLKWVANREKNRWFLVLIIKRPHGNELNGFLARCNQAAKSFDLPGLYEGEGDLEELEESTRVESTTLSQSSGDTEARRRYRDYDVLDRGDCFHFSIAWTLESPSQFGNERESGGVNIQANSLKGMLNMEAAINAVKLKVGNSITSLPLSQPKEQGGGRKGIFV